ncbi:SAV_2336 N-terminal domain-related protein [Streptomyces sp. NPDC001595]
MSSEPSELPAAVARLADVLAEASGGPRPAPLELAELLWLARHMTDPDHRGPHPPPPPAERPERPPSPPRPPDHPAPRPATDPAPAADPAPGAEAEAGRAPLHLPAPEPAPGTATAPHTSLLAPAPPMLPHPLPLQRALRPLGRRVDSPTGREPDERATADRIARLGAAPEWWLPVLRPVRERWLRLNLVHDAGPTMPVWRPLVRELHTALARSGLFRTVSLYRAGPDGTVRGQAAQGPADGRTVTLLISDCMGPQWREGPAGTRWHTTLRGWARRMPLAVVQPLPEHLWRDTALPTVAGRLSAPHPAAPAAALTFTPYETPDPRAAGRSLVLPVLEPAPRWLANWAALLTAPGRREVPAAVGVLGRPLPADADDRTDVARLSPEELVLRFRETASPEAFRLAGHLAVGRPDLPVMRLVQAAVEPRPRPQHLAEVILSGMLTTAPGPPGSYRFRPGVAELLLRSVPRTARGRTTELVTRVGALIDTAAGRAPGEFRAATPSARGTEAAVDGEAFAAVSAESVRRLAGRPAGELFAGRYRLLERVGTAGANWLAEDVRKDDERVLVRRHSPLIWDREDFTEVARRLTAVRHPGIAAVQDYGVADGFTYLVREYVDGLPLPDLAERDPGGLSAARLTALLPPLVEALDALHAHGRPHGGLDASQILLTARGPVLTCLDGLSVGTGSRAEDLRSLGVITSSLYRREQLSAPLADELDTAVTELASALPETQERGADRLRHLAERQDGTLTVSLLGPLLVTRGRRRVAVDGEEQGVLALLALRPGRPVALREVAGGLWEGAFFQQQAHELADVHAERLLPDLGPRLARADGGWVLDVDADDVDVLRFRRLADEAGDAHGAGDLRRARERARAALELWRGEPLKDVPGPAARAVRAELRTLRRTLLDLLAAPEPAAAPAPEPTPALTSAPERTPERAPEPTPAPEPATIAFTAGDLTGRPEARVALEVAVHDILTRGSLARHQYEVIARADGYLVRADPAAYLLPVLVAVLRTLPGAFAELRDPPRLRVAFRGAAVPERPAAAVLVAVPPALYEEYAGSSAALRRERFHPLFGPAPDAAPVAWHCRLSPPDDEERDLVRGPFTTPDPRDLGIPAPGRTAVVHLAADGPPTLLDPAVAIPYGGNRPRVATYYEVDLTTHQAHGELVLPSSGKGDFSAAVDLSWRVADPVAFVRAGLTGVAEALLARVRDHAAAITRRHPLRRAAGAERAVNAKPLGRPLPGLAVTCSVRLAPERAAAPARPAESGSLPGLLAAAETVLIGFDGPIARLYSAAAAREAALDLLRLVGEHRDPEDALTGRRLAVEAVREGAVHPLDVLRAFAHDRLGPVLRRRLDEVELAAVRHAPATHHCVPLIRALRAAGRGVDVVTDVGAAAVHRYLESHRLPLDGVHGRDEDLARLMPDPDRLLRALRRAGAPVEAGVLIGASPAEAAAARRLGLRFVGLARNPTVERQLREAGCEVTVPSLGPLLDAASAL